MKLFTSYIRRLFALNLKRTTYNLQLKRPFSFSLSALSFSLIILLFHVRCATARPQFRELGIGATGVALDTAIDLTTQGLRIGQEVPDITLNNIYKYKTRTAKVADFRGKLLILDFWATWCSPCVAMIPKMDSLQKAFEGKVQFLSVTYQQDEEVLPFLNTLEKRQGRSYNLPVLTADTVLHRLFPHRVLPHYIWIGANGKVEAITGQDEITGKELNAFLSGHTELDVKKDKFLNYDKGKPLFLVVKDTKRPVWQQSTFSGYLEGIERGYIQNLSLRDSMPFKRITATNLSVAELYQMAFHKEQKETAVEVANKNALIFDEKAGKDFSDWAGDDHVFCYELILQNRQAKKGFSKMKQDLENFFPSYSAYLESRKVKCLTLVRTSDRDKIRAKENTPKAQFDRFGCKMTSCYLRVFISRMKYFLQNYPLPLADETGYAGKADLELNCNLSNVEELNRALAAYDLQLVEKEAVVDILVIKDKP